MTTHIKTVTKVEDSVMPDAYTSPMSYSLSVDESVSPIRHHYKPMSPPPLPSAKKTDKVFASLVLTGARQKSTVWGATTKKGVQDLRTYIENMTFSPHKDRVPVQVSTKNQGSVERNQHSKKGLRDRTNQAPFPEMTPTAKTPRSTSNSPQKQTPRTLNEVLEPASTTTKPKNDPPTISEMSSLLVDLSIVENEDKAWKRLEDVAAKVRLASDPEPSSLAKEFEEAESTVLRTAFTELGPQRQQQYESSCQEALAENSASFSCHSSFVFQQDHDESIDKVRIASPEDAKKLLRTAVSALHDARAERESARQWAIAMKQAVNKWVEEQRRLVNTETTTRIGALEAHEAQIQTQAASLSKLERSIQSVYEEIVSSNETRHSTEKRLQRILLSQQDKIHELGQQLSSIEQTVTEQGTRSSMASPRADDVTGQLPSPKETVIPHFVDKTPGTKNTGSSQTSSSSTRIKRRTKDGGHLIAYSNGVQKEVHPDGTTVIRFVNGDVETKFAESGTVAYFHKEDLVLQITTTDGSTLYEYPNHQIERHFPDGSKAILYPDGTKQKISPKSRAESFSFRG